MKVSIVYNSHTGTTKKYAQEIEKFLEEKGVETTLSSLEEFNKEDLQSSELILLGTWTSGLFFFAQHPDKKWKQNISKLSGISDKKICLFTTYKTLTGSMFRKMQQSLNLPEDTKIHYLKSRSSKLTEQNKEELEKCLN